MCRNVDEKWSRRKRRQRGTHMQIKTVVKHGSLKVTVFFKQCLIPVGLDQPFIAFCNLFQNGETAMHIAARNGQLKMLQALMEEGGDPTQQSKVGVFQNNVDD